MTFTLAHIEQFMPNEVDELLLIIPKEQIMEVFNQKDCEIEACFLGFTDIYKHLSAIIPKHFTVIDLGCCYAPQSFYFKEHKQYIGVDISKCIKFHANNSRFYCMSIESFIKNHSTEFLKEETFAICSYVPPWGADNIKLVRENFINVFTYYPHGGFEI